MGGSDIRSIGILERLVGEENMDNVLLVTNMWDILGPSAISIDGHRASSQEIGEKRETELIRTPEFWGNLIQGGARYDRNSGGSWKSAHRLIHHFMSRDSRGGLGRTMKLRLQQELVDRKLRLEETVVGKFINDELYSGQKILENDIELIRKKHNRLKEGYGKGGSAAATELELLLETKKQGLRDARKKAEILGRKVDELVDENGIKVGLPPVGRTSGTHGGLCKVM